MKLNFKRILGIMLSMVMLFSFAACGGAENDEPDKEPYSSEATVDASSETSSVEETDTVFALNETAVFKDLKITATEYKETVGEEYFGPEEGNIFVGVKFTIEGIAEKEQSISSLLQFAAYVDDMSCDYSFTGSMAFDATVDGTINAGKKIVGWYTVEVPEDWNEIQIDFTADLLSNSKASFVIEHK